MQEAGTSNSFNKAILINILFLKYFLGMHIFQKFSPGLNIIIGSVPTEPQPHSQCFLRMELIKGLVNFGRLSKSLICLQTNAISPLSQLTQSFLSSAHCYPSYSYCIVCSKMFRDGNSFCYYLSSNHLRALDLNHCFPVSLELFLNIFFWTSCQFKIDMKTASGFTRWNFSPEHHPFWNAL